jgi:hypothetical protein
MTLGRRLPHPDPGRHEDEHQDDQQDEEAGSGPAVCSAEPRHRGRAYPDEAIPDDRRFNRPRRLRDREREAEGRAGAQGALELDRAAVGPGDDL